MRNVTDATTNHAVIDVLACLEQISLQRMLPEQAASRLSPLRARHENVAIELVWDEQAFDGSVHYDALIRPQGANATISLSMCTDDALPWPLRGLQATQDSELLRVNGVVMSVATAVQRLDLLWQDQALMQRLIDSCLIEAELQSREIHVTPAEVQAAFDDMRQRRGLLAAADVQAWLAQAGMSLHGLTSLAAKLARAAKLRDQLVGPQVDAYIERHRESFDVVTARILQAPARSITAEVREAMSSGEHTFLDAAQDAFVRDSTARTRLYYRKDSRYRLAADLSADAAQLNVGALIGPIARGEEVVLLDIFAVAPAERSEQLRIAAATRLFEEWLRERRHKARIEWSWGSSRQTDGTPDALA